MQNVKSFSFLKAQTQLLRYTLSKRYFTQVFRPTYFDKEDDSDIFLSDNFENVKSEQYIKFWGTLSTHPSHNPWRTKYVFWSRKNSWIFKKKKVRYSIQYQWVQDFGVYENPLDLGLVFGFKKETFWPQVLNFRMCLDFIRFGY